MPMTLDLFRIDRLSIQERDQAQYWMIQRMFQGQVFLEGRTMDYLDFAKSQLKDSESCEPHSHQKINNSSVRIRCVLDDLPRR